MSKGNYRVDIISGGWPVDPKYIKGERYIPLEDGAEYKIRMVNDSDRRVNAYVTIDANFVGSFRIDDRDDFIIERPGTDRGNKKFVFVKAKGFTARISGVDSQKEENGLISVRFVPEKRSYHSYDYGYGGSLPEIPRYYSSYSSYPRMMSGSRPSNEALSFASPSSAMLPPPGSSRPSSSSAMLMSSARKESSPANESLSTSASFTSARSPSEYKQSAYSTGATVGGDKSHQSFGTAKRMEEDESDAVVINVRLIVKEKVTVDYIDDWQPQSNRRPPRVDDR